MQKTWVIKLGKRSTELSPTKIQKEKWQKIQELRVKVLCPEFSQCLGCPQYILKCLEWSTVSASNQLPDDGSSLSSLSPARESQIEFQTHCFRLAMLKPPGSEPVAERPAFPNPPFHPKISLHSSNFSFLLWKILCITTIT